MKTRKFWKVRVEETNDFRVVVNDGPICDPVGLGITNSYTALGLQRCDPVIPTDLSTRFSGTTDMRDRGFDYQTAARLLRPELARAKRTRRDGAELGRCRQLELAELLPDAPEGTPGGNSSRRRWVFLDQQEGEDRSGQGEWDG